MSRERSLRRLVEQQQRRAKQWRRVVRYAPAAALALAAAGVSASAQTSQAPDITKKPTLYVVPYAHLDTQWRWEFPQVISEYLLKTLRVNFDYIDKYPHYVFNWTGSNRYRLMKEYFPDDYARMTKYVAAGRWYPAGSSVEEGDVNLPSAEGLFRQVLYGNTYYRREFGKYSEEYMIPDCFGFPASLPTILHHAGVKGFSTQKLNAEWQPAPKVGGPDSPEKTPEGIPFNVGRWIGPDGTSVLAALNPGTYGGNTYTDISKVNAPTAVPKLSDAEVEKLTPQQRRIYERIGNRDREQNWVERIDLNGKVTGVYADYHYVGTGDVGGATQESTVKLLEAIVTKSETVLPIRQMPDFLKTAMPAPGAPVRVGEGPVTVIEATADQLFKDVKPDMATKMPTVQGDLELINHSAGSLTSQAYHKRWVLKNELLADAAEKASVAAAWMGGQPYPQQRLTDAWTLALGGHFHDTAAGTATPRSYEFAWNDDVLTANQFAGVFASATASVAGALDTSGSGTPLVLYNNLNVDREDLVEAKLPAELAGAKAVSVKGPGGEALPAQVVDGKALFAAKVPSVGYAVYHVAAGGGPKSGKTLKVTKDSLENERYLVKLNGDGDVSSIFDKQLKKELLSAPIRLTLNTDTPKQWPAWNMDFDQVTAKPRAYVSGPAQVRIKEDGPVRVALEIKRSGEGSTYVETVSLAAGDAGNRVEFANAIDWRGKAENLKVAFPLTASNPNATYNEDVGVVERPNASERQFEVVSHKWIDLTDKSGSYGVTILTDNKNASDKDSDNTIRLTLIRTPSLQPNATAYSDQANQDWGHHEFTFGLAGHAGGWREAQTDWQAYRLNDPIRAFSTTAHPGTLGKQFSLLRVDNPRVRVFAMKKAETSDEYVLRLAELDGKPANNVHVKFAGPVTAVQQMNAQELPEEGAEGAAVSEGTLSVSLKGYEPKTLALKFGAAPASVQAIASQPVALTYDVATATNDDTPSPGGGFDGKGDAYPAEMLPEKVLFHGVDFDLGKAATGTPNAVTAKGQAIPLPAGDFNRVYVLAASTNGDQTAEFRLGSQSVKTTVQDWGGFIGQWDTRLWKNVASRDWAVSAHHATWPPADLQASERPDPSPRYPEDYVALRAGYIKPAEVAWYASHHHTATGLNQPYAYSYLFGYAMDLPKGATTLTLPNAPGVRIFAVSVTREQPKVEAAEPLFDTLGRQEPPQGTEQ